MSLSKSSPITAAERLALSKVDSSDSRGGSDDTSAFSHTNWPVFSGSLCLESDSSQTSRGIRCCKGLRSSIAFFPLELITRIFAARISPHDSLITQ